MSQGPRILMGIAFLVSSVTAWAQGEAASSPALFLYPILIAAGIAYVTRRMAIGGWLFYYYLALYLSGALAIWMAVVTFPDLHPDGWDHFYWVLAVVSYVPLLLSKIAELAFATRLLFRSQRTAQNLTIMRYILVVQIAFNVLGVAIGYKYFPEDTSGNMLGVIALIVVSLWCAYFYVSKRVRHVLADGSREWSYEDFRNRLAESPSS